MSLINLIYTYYHAHTYQSEELHLISRCPKVLCATLQLEVGQQVLQLLVKLLQSKHVNRNPNR